LNAARAVTNPAAGQAGRPRIALALILHNHQPIGNFDWVIEETYQRAYEPMLAALERHPGVRMGLHYSGPLLEWLEGAHPDFSPRLAALLARDQIELLGGGWYEPVLVALPEADRNGQLARSADELERRFGARPAGAWLTERVWEPSIPSDLGRAGYGWTVVDDEHLRGAAVPPEASWTAFTTDDQGWRISLLATEQGLRYRIPFGEVDDFISHLRQHASVEGDLIGVMGDDGEKFGAWPTTYDHCWGERAWVDRCFEALEANQDWLATVRPSDWLRDHPPVTRVYPGTSSYLEMTEWALPADVAGEFQRMVSEAKEAGRPEARFLSGGNWRAFQARYREVNDLKAQMLRASAAVAAMAPGPAQERARDHLYRGQSNDCYWHGVFGGIYLVHLRLASLTELIAAEDEAAGGARARPVATLTDWDLDGRVDALLSDAGQSCVVDLAEGAGLSTWDLRASRAALLSVLRRRPEAYHARLRAGATEAGVGSDEAPGPYGLGLSDETASTIHDLVGAIDPGLEASLHYDRHERRGGLIRILPAGTSLGQLREVKEHELGDFVSGPFELVRLRPGELVTRRDGTVRTEDGTTHALRVTKRLRLAGTRQRPTLSLSLTAGTLDGRPLECDLALEWGFDLAGGGHNPAAWYETRKAGRRVRLPHDGSSQQDAAHGVAFGNDALGVRVRLTMEPVGRLGWYPIETVNSSEAGFERVYQGSCLLQRWPLRLAPGERATVRVRLTAITREAADDATR
jgi:4-alpha-glucanotransferase